MGTELARQDPEFERQSMLGSEHLFPIDMCIPLGSTCASHLVGHLFRLDQTMKMDEMEPSIVLP